ncbi:MAG: exopolysaccharide biosynthesis polyprenyl glycosylphosphotransferase [Bacteroidetes bacterium]|jgi:exopolysaccharide biosynthesis polyprenyl glycosylphosphotransferase|nr:exopolysaccharide biosynthesis polyprenyl glycosylphosphotransferase [Bacteroidota bacterium]
MNKRLQVAKYLFFDLASAVAAWTSFFIYRKYYIEPEKFGVDPVNIFSEKYYLGVVVIPVCWLMFYYIVGNYNNIYRKSRLSELLNTMLTSIIGVTIIFFISILDDEVRVYKNYYQSYFTLLGLQFGLTAMCRFVLSSINNYQIHNRKKGFKTIIVGSNENALKMYEEIQALKNGTGNLFVGFVHVDEKNGFSEQLQKQVPHLGEFGDIGNIINKYEIEEIIIAIESWEHEYLGQVINDLSDTGIIIKIIPDMYDILSGSVKMTSIFGAPLIEINRKIMPEWQQAMKRLLDVSISVFVLICFSWVYILVAIIVKLGSKGPVFYFQERIGIHGKPFKIIKFRSMYIDAERAGPALSSQHDPRITPFGRFMRKTRVDELPQFFNVLISEMSIVGPRPERQFFIDQIVQKAPHYKHLHKVRPGITSWGQVKYGYAETVDQMVQRLKYDIIYIENMSLIVDLKIMIYTALIMIQGRGK